MEKVVSAEDNLTRLSSALAADKQVLAGDKGTLAVNRQKWFEVDAVMESNRRLEEEVLALRSDLELAEKAHFEEANLRQLLQEEVGSLERDKAKREREILRAQKRWVNMYFQFGAAVNEALSRTGGKDFPLPPAIPDNVGVDFPDLLAKVVEEINNTPRRLHAAVEEECHQVPYVL